MQESRMTGFAKCLGFTGRVHQGLGVLAILFIGLFQAPVQASVSGPSLGYARCPFGAEVRGTKLPAKVTRVSDGDTVRVSFDGVTGSYAIRFLSIDTPELHFPWGGRMHNQGPIAQEATDYLLTLISVGDRVHIEIDQEVCDKYGRVLGYVWKGTKNINKAMLDAAYAVNYCMVPNLKYCESFAKVVARTSLRREGVFSDPKFKEPYVWRADVRGEGPTKFVADFRTKLVYEPAAITKIPVAYRVFFTSESQVRPPFQWAQ